jgi:hypothetical protein
MLSHIHFRLGLALIFMAGAPACWSSPPPTVTFEGLTYPDLALGQTVRVSVAVSGAESRAQFSTENPAVLGVTLVTPAQGSRYELDLAALSTGRTDLIIEVDGSTFTQELSVAPAVAVGLRAAELRNREARAWPESAKIVTGRTFTFTTALRAADGRFLMSSEPIELVETEQVFWLGLSPPFDRDFLLVNVSEPGEVEVALDAGDAAPLTTYRLTAVAPDTLVGIGLEPDEIPSGPEAVRPSPPCVTAVGLDAEGDTVAGVDVEWFEGERSVGVSDRACYLYGTDETVLGARLGEGDALETTVIRGYGAEPRPSATGCSLFCP